MRNAAVLKPEDRYILRFWGALNMTSIAVHLYINGYAMNVYNLNKLQAKEFHRALLQHLKPINKNQYLELDLDSNEEYGILKCTNEHDTFVELPTEVVSKINRYMYIPVSNNVWNTEDKISVLLSLM
jgi:hypothetical protein